MRTALVITIALSLVSVTMHALADDLIATRPGVMCRSAETLGKLTLPGGDSRTHAARPRPEDLQLAASGGCVDITPGARVTVQQAFHNTSVVTTGAADATPMVVPNADFRPASAREASTPGSVAAPAPSATSAAPPTGYAVVQRLAVAGSGSPVLVLLEDHRLTPKLREQLWDTGGPDVYLDPHDPQFARLTRPPLLAARLQLLSPAGQVLGETREKDYALARIEPAPIHGLPMPTFLYTVDMSAGIGGFSGPATVLLTPTTRGLEPAQAVPEGGGKPTTFGFMSTVHAGWQIVPARHSGPEEIEDATCDRTTSDGRLILTTYRFRDGQWRHSERNGGACVDVEMMPPRNAFP